MQVVPVIDIQQGQVVRAVRGERANYRPLVSQLCVGAEPCRIARGMLEYCNSDLLYVADLDGLSGSSPQFGVLARLLQALPATELWFDAGFGDADDWHRLERSVGAEAGRLRPVFASEALASPAAARDALAAHPRALLSLDRHPAGLPDRAGCWSDPALWPRQVIVMTLDRVGSFAGPDLVTLAALKDARPDLEPIGAGGIRGQCDLAAAASSGAVAWLVASALHERRICPPFPA